MCVAEARRPALCARGGGGGGGGEARKTVCKRRMLQWQCADQLALFLSLSLSAYLCEGKVGRYIHTHKHT
jgi:hypothetical protein